MIISMAYPGRYMRFFYFALVGLLIFDFAFYPLAAHAQSRRTARQAEEKSERSSPRPFTTLVPEESEKEVTPPVEIKSIGKAAYDAVIRSGRYIVGPGDVFAVVVNRGEEIETFEVPVGASGSLLFPSVGPVSVAFLSLTEANQAIQTAIKKRFHQLDISIGLARLRTFPINVVGEVHMPGAVDVEGVEQASQLITKAGGLIDDFNRKGSSRNIQIMSLDENGQWHNTGRRIDLELWNRTGKAQYNPFLLDGEQIVVPVARSDSIYVTGAVKYPGSYEFAPGDRVADLIILGNGLRAHSPPKRAHLLRLSDDSDWTSIDIDLPRVLAGDPQANLTLQAGDKLYVIGETKRVYVEGEVKFPGPFPFKEGLRLKELLQQAELTPEASVVQASLIRKVNFEEQTIEDDPALNRLLGIPRSQRTDAEEALITLKTQQFSGRLPIDFVALMAGDERHNILLQDGDVVRIPRFVSSVRVTGAVVAPANIPYDAVLTVGGYIDLAGGFNTRAKRKDIIIIEGNTGNAIPATSESLVRPGDAIVVPTQAIVPGQGYRITREVIAMLGSVASLVFTIVLINREL
ncbi:MAG: SLBB domain-containing protein [Candidatus Latescibacteria bacterium]|nr:SLBB domain-containing protein [Candidatus Latescibacterota bacterium]